MSARLGAALVEYIRSLGGTSKFVLVEGLAIDLAQAMAAAWHGPGLPELAVASAQPGRFGPQALSGASGTSLRNRHPGGVCIVVCEGQQLPDRQSLRSFENVAPSELLGGVEPLLLLARAVRAAPLDGPARAVRQAILTAKGDEKPAVAAVARYFDALADGADPLRSLPLLGAFADDAQGGRVDTGRVAENLRLASRRRAEDVLAPSATAAARQRARRVLGRRMAPDEADRRAAELLRLLQSGDDALLERITFDEALEILDRAVPDLAEEVERQLQDYRRERGAPGADDPLPWERYRSAARALRRPGERRAAAQDLLELDDLERRAVFEPATRQKLERLMRDRAISAGSCPEAALVRAALSLDGGLRAIDAIAPDPPTGSHTRTAAQSALVLATARLRLAGLLRRLAARGVRIDGLLLTDPADGLWDEVFEDADLSARRLPALELRVEGGDGGRVQVNWSPDLDDVAALRQAMLLAESTVLTLAVAGAPTLGRFCAGPAPTSTAPHERLAPVAGRLRAAASACLATGLSPDALDLWCAAWRAAVEAERAAERNDALEALALAGAAVGGGSVGLGVFSPPKSEWAAQYLRALWELAEAAAAGGEPDEPVEATAAGIQRTTASQQPAFIRVSTSDRPLLPISEGRVWGVYGSGAAADEGGYSAEALGGVIDKLIAIQPEAAGHLRCMAWGPGAADLLLERATAMLAGSGAHAVREIEIFCAGHRPSDAVLAVADDAMAANGREGLSIRYLGSLEDAAARLSPGRHGEPAVHLAVATGLSAGGDRLQIPVQEVGEPELDGEVLFAPRTSVRPNRAGRVLLMPPAATETGLSWLRLVSAMDDGWSEEAQQLRVPELRLGALDLAEELRRLHDLALWVATIDRYATRDSLERALGEEIAILHQERRLNGESPTSLVISQRSGGPADRAIGRSLRSAGIIAEAGAAFRYGTAIRKVASQGYGILALEAATSGAGINELLGHVVAFSLLSTTTTPWPLPPNCRVLLVGLDDYKGWFQSGKRADLLAIAVDPEENGVHTAAIEVKARRSDPQLAGAEALDQLRQTLAVTRWAAYPVAGSIHSRLWLNRIAEAAYSVVRESRFKLDASELGALEQFRRGSGTLEWAGLGLVFGPSVQDQAPRHYHHAINGDRVPIVVRTIRLSEPVIEQATDTRLGELYTVEADSPPLDGGRVRRRPEAGQGRRARSDRGEPTAGEQGTDAGPESEPGPPGETETAPTDLRPAEPGDDRPAFVAPVIGWDLVGGEEVRWSAAGEGGARLGNGHVEIWGSSGAGKTQFTMALLAQVAQRSGTRFGIADFKNDYGGTFPGASEAEFLDLWNEGAPYNPLALPDAERRTVERAVIELRDAVEVAARSFTRMGHRQLVKLRSVLDQAYEAGRREQRWPTMLTVNDLLDDDISGVIGDLTRSEIFKDGPPLGDVVDRNVIFGFSHIPGNGLTTVLAAGFVLSALLLKIQGMPPVANTIRYCIVVDEAHRVADFKAIDTMVREGRSKGLSVILATQQPGDLPDVVATNAATKACFRLPDATVAAAAARRLDPSDPTLPEQIRTLGVGEAFVSLGGGAPRLLSMAQLWRDRQRLGLATNG
ncbi:MAG: DUF853 family protein [Actinomycetota bacterium]|nr:DUF853 family protein [Actinomycetota bacterium]